MDVPSVLPGAPAAMNVSAEQLRRAAEAVRQKRPPIDTSLPSAAFSGPAAPYLRHRLHDASEVLARAAASLDEAAVAMARQALKVADSIDAHNSAIARNNEAVAQQANER